MTTRVSTPEGFLRAGAVLTRGGEFTYSRQELGLDGEGPIIVTRSRETLEHPETLASLRGAPITLGHPDGGVTPDNFQDVVVGSVVGEPRIAGNEILGDTLVGDRGALERVDAGEDELSIGYDFTLGRNSTTVGPLRVNHVAIVPKGRAGSGVRIMDSAIGDEESEMTDQERQAIIEDAAAAALKALGSSSNGNDAVVTAAVKDAINPALDKIEELRKDAEDRKLAEDKEKAEAEAKSAAAKLVKDTEDRVRAEQRLYIDALPFIPEEKREAMRDADQKTILVAALGDSVPNAADQSVEYLTGALAFLKKQNDAAASAGTNGSYPPGVLPIQQPVTATDSRQKAIDEYSDALMKRYTEAGGR